MSKFNTPTVTTSGHEFSITPSGGHVRVQFAGRNTMFLTGEEAKELLDWLTRNTLRTADEAKEFEDAQPAAV